MMVTPSVVEGSTCQRKRLDALYLRESHDRVARYGDGTDRGKNRESDSRIGDVRENVFWLMI